MALNNTYDIIIAGAGSVGTACAFFMSQAGLKVLVIECLPSSGQASNKRAIGGVRATFSDPSKIFLGAKGIEVFSSWQATYGDDIEWYQGGYSFVAYDQAIESSLKALLETQQNLGLAIHWLDRDEILKLAPDLNPQDLRGGTYSPGDGSASPLKANYAFYSHALQQGAEFHFNENVLGVEKANGKVNGVRTNQGIYFCKAFINAAGSWAAEISEMVGVKIPVKPDAHEAGITESVQPMFSPMIVDIRERPGSSNFYFYQHPSGKIIFCVTPNPQIWGLHDQDTGSFLPLACRRLMEIMPRLANCRIRRTWRGTYPMTPDGNPLLGAVPQMEGYLLAAGLCGQGFMLGPGVAKLLTNLVLDDLSPQEKACLEANRYNREFTTTEKLK